MAKMLISAFILASFANAITSFGGNFFYINKDFHSKGVCSYKGYMPGGGTPNISPIKPPTATMPANALAKIAGLGSKGASLAMHSSNLMKAFGKGSALFLKIAPKLGPALGVFGAALGFVSALTSPTPQDILNQANKAIAKLTAEVNDRLVKMEGYVDYKVIQLEKDLVNREYRSLFNLFGNCVKEATKNQVNECMRDAETKASSDAPKYTILDTKMGAYTDSTEFRSYYDSNPSKAPSFYDVKRIEAGIISFRDFATLHLLMISTLLDTYKSDASLPNAAFYVTRYTREQASAGTSVVTLPKICLIIKPCSHMLCQKSYDDLLNVSSKMARKVTGCVENSFTFLYWVLVSLSLVSLHINALCLFNCCNYDGRTSKEVGKSWEKGKRALYVLVCPYLPLTLTFLFFHFLIYKRDLEQRIATRA